MADTHPTNPFVDQLLHDLRLDQLPEPQRTTLLNKITELAERRVLQTIVANLTEGQLTEFEQKLQSGMSADEAATFMIERIPGLAAKVEGVLRELYEELLSDINQIDQTLAALPEAPPPPVPPQSQ